jgi:predicted small lipoprotein YifL
VKCNYCPRASGWAVILLSAAALALGGCGRKAGLDLPPNAAAQSSAPMTDSEAERANKPSVFNPYYGTNAPPTAPRGTKKSFILDPLLNSD